MRSLLLLSFFFQLTCFANQSYSVTIDTSGKILSAEQRFLEQYGTDDISKKIIHKYFSQRRSYKWTILGALILGIGSGIGVDHAGSHESSLWSSLGKNIAFGLGVIFSGIIILVSSGVFIFNSPKRLAKILDRYHATGKLPGRYKNLK